MSESDGHPIGRPRKHANSTARVQAYRLAHDLRKVTVDIPSPFVMLIQRLAHWLRGMRTDFAFSRHADWRTAFLGSSGPMRKTDGFVGGIY